VSTTEHNAMTPTAESGFLAMLAGLFPARGTGASSHRPRLRPLPFLLALAFLAPLAASALAPAPAFANECDAADWGLVEPVNRTLTSVVLGGRIFLREAACEAQWTIEWSTTPNGPWQEFPGGHGTVTGGLTVEFETGELTGLEPETVYHQRGILKVGSQQVNEEHGTFEAKLLRPDRVGVESAGVGETSARVKGQFAPAPFETRWRIEYATSRSTLDAGGGTLAGAGVVSQAEAEALQTATGAKGFIAEPEISGLSPSTKYFVRMVAEDEPEWPPSSGVKLHKVVVSPDTGFETHGPPVAEASGTPALHGELIRALGYVVPHGFDTHYRFQYGPTTAYGSETPEEDVGSGGASGSEAAAAAADLHGLTPGQTYHYRILASSLAGGGVTVHGADHTVTVPVPGEGAGGGEESARPCPNEALRTGASARLPDCRAYEQVTPVEKGGALQAFSYANQLSGVGALVGEDGEHLVYEDPLVHWGTGNGPYFFSRDPQHGWQMTPGGVQPEAGIDEYKGTLFSPNLNEFAFAAGWKTAGTVESPSLEFKAGGPGGPYVKAASITRADVAEVGSRNSTSLGWVAASGDFSKLILATTDRAVVSGHASSTSSGADLYEYAGGVLYQANVTTVGAAIGACGATVAKGAAERVTAASTSSPHTVSSDGGRVLFYATPGSDCTQPQHLFMRTGGGTPGARTLDIGVYAFLAADPSDSKLLLEAPGAETQQLVLYETVTETTRTLQTLHEQHQANQHLTAKAAQDLSTVYIYSREQLTADAPPPTGGEHSVNASDLYRYDVGTGALRFVVQALGASDLTVSADGRHASFQAALPNFYSVAHGLPRESFLYDGVRNLVECASCASSFNPEPYLYVAPSYFEASGVLESANGAPKVSLLAADGRRLFFDTRATLLPSDVDGESPEPFEPGGTKFWSPASDVYEWRANGVEGCVQVQGCLALISSGRGGYLVQLLGADPSGKNVFFTTQERLAGSDGDNSIDIYDARSGGGFPPAPPAAVECAGDACHPPFSAPSDLSPSSAMFQGAGNVLAPTPPVVLTAKPKPKAKARCRPTRRRKCKARRRKKPKHARRSSSSTGSAGR
jgi:hypothetical protein